MPFSARAPLDLLEKLDAIAEKNEWTRSQAVTEAIRRLVS